MCIKRTLVLACRGDSELTLGLFCSVSEIIVTFLLTRDCRFVYCVVLIVDLSFNYCFTYNTKFYFDPLCYKVKNVIDSDTLTLPPT